MIEITTLFLALVFGPQIVELDVSAEVDEVEIVLDGRSMGRVAGPPWAARVDLGPELIAHRLKAIAYDERGRELDRAVTFVNLGHEDQGGTMALIEGPDGRPVAVSLGWESLGQREPVDAEVTFDGDVVSWDDPKRILLPGYDPDGFHFVSATLRFHDGSSSRKELGFGGPLGNVSSQLTAVAVQATADARPPKAKQLATAFRLTPAGRRLQVHGVEKGQAEVILVRDTGIQPTLDALVRRISGGVAALVGRDRPTQLTTESEPEDRLNSLTLRDFGKLPRKTQLRIMAPRGALLRPTGVSPDMFLISDPLDGHRRGLLGTVVQEPAQQFPKHLASAVALAGKVAQGSQRPRAVVLILGDGSDDVSHVTPEAARAYLRDLGVPLFVWAFEPIPRNTGWGEILSLGPAEVAWDTRKAFEDRVQELGDSLRRQRLVWLEGSHLPREIELSPEVKDVEIAGRNPSAP